MFLLCAYGKDILLHGVIFSVLWKDSREYFSDMGRIKLIAIAVRGSHDRDNARVFSGLTNKCKANEPAVCVVKEGTRGYQWCQCESWKHSDLHNGVLDNGGLNHACMVLEQSIYDSPISGDGTEDRPRLLKGTPFEFCTSKV